MKSLRHTTAPSFNRRTLAADAMQAAIRIRANAKLDQYSPICIYGLCDELGVIVRFNDINMEGMYQHGVPPRIHLSALRPLPRRAFSCAHELGHHIFEHGTSIDELSEDARQQPWQDPKEFSVDAFAGFTLMPIMGLRRAFATRGWAPQTATAAQMFTIACHFGVGYGTLLTHLASGVNLITRARATALKRTTPKALRRDILGAPAPEPLIVADRYYAAPTLDAEVRMLLCLPPDAKTTGDCLAYERDLPNGRLFRTVRPGIVQANAASGSWATFVRVAPEAYVGLARYRHLGECPG